MKKEYDYLVVGAGLFGAVFAHEAALAGKRCLVIDKRNHAGGNIYCQETEGIQVHAYGAHIFHTDQAEIWEYANRFVRFNRFTNAPLARYRDELYNLPFNMNTFHQLWGVKTPAEARARLAVECEKYAYIETPANLEEQALKLGGKDIYERLIKGYTEKQWGRSARELPAFIIRRLPFRFTFDNNYFNDAFFDYRYGHLEYRSLRFESALLEIPDFQGNAVVNYTERDIPFTRIIEHKHFEFGQQPCTVITHEYPEAFQPGKEPYYPVNDEKNTRLFQSYQQLAAAHPQVFFGGRLAQYTYADMDDTIAAALQLWKKEYQRILEH